MISALTKQTDGTLQLTITIAWSEVVKTREKVLEQYTQGAQVPGFRKGKAPKKLVEEKVDNEKLREDILRNLLPSFYTEAIKEHNLKPIMSPRIQVAKLEDEKDWQFIAYTCEFPQVDITNYKDAVQKITAKSKIVLPGKEKQEVNLDEIVKAVLEHVKITIPQILLDGEVERQLSQTLDEIKRLGLTLDQYLASTGRSVEDLRNDYAKKAQNDITLEFALQKIAQDEKITVDEKEINEAIAKAKDENEKKNLETNRYLLASILRQQKTLDFLRSL
ncbi:MAG TPA: trigger factor [Candidatus Saccharimonadales bacterium]|nr:trigger factor [Candidatus Saccharimonadales bacterium]